jgi:ribosomal-protein-alanine N-acetyltransferase
VLKTNTNVLLLPLMPNDANVVAAVHQRSFTRPWPAADFMRFAHAPECHGVVAWHNGAIAGFIVICVVCGDAEILTIAIDPVWRRQGIASSLLARAMENAADQGAEALFLEVGVRNEAALSLYERLGFIRAGRRPKYYSTPEGPEDAIVMKRLLPKIKASCVA